MCESESHPGYRYYKSDLNKRTLNMTILKDSHLVCVCVCVSESHAGYRYYKSDLNKRTLNMTILKDSHLVCVCVSESHPGYRYYRVSRKNKRQCELLMITPPNGSSLIELTFSFFSQRMIVGINTWFVNKATPF